MGLFISPTIVSKNSVSTNPNSIQNWADKKFKKMTFFLLKYFFLKNLLEMRSESRQNIRIVRRMEVKETLFLYLKCLEKAPTDWFYFDATKGLFLISWD